MVTSTHSFQLRHSYPKATCLDAVDVRNPQTANNQPFQLAPLLRPSALIEVQPHALLGIELTEMYREAAPNKRPLQADESVRTQVVDRARELFEQNGGPILEVSFHFSLNEEWAKSRVGELAPKISRSDILTAAKRVNTGLYRS